MTLPPLRLPRLGQVLSEAQVRVSDRPASPATWVSMVNSEPGRPVAAGVLGWSFRLARAAVHTSAVAASPGGVLRRGVLRARWREHAHVAPCGSGDQAGGSPRVPLRPEGFLCAGGRFPLVTRCHCGNTAQPGLFSCEGGRQNRHARPRPGPAVSHGRPLRRPRAAQQTRSISCETAGRDAASRPGAAAGRRDPPSRPRPLPGDSRSGPRQELSPEREPPGSFCSRPLLPSSLPPLHFPHLNARNTRIIKS